MKADPVLEGLIHKLLILCVNIVPVEKFLEVLVGQFKEFSILAERFKVFSCYSNGAVVERLA